MNKESKYNYDWFSSSQQVFCYFIHFYGQLTTCFDTNQQTFENQKERKQNRELKFKVYSEPLMADFHKESSSSEEILKSEADYGHFHHNINPDCPVCHKPVFWCKLIVSAGRAYHSNCFICSYCSKSLKVDDYSKHGGKLYCTIPCFNRIVVGQFKSFTGTLSEDGEEVNSDSFIERKPTPVSRCKSCERMLLAEDKISETRIFLEKRISQSHENELSKDNKKSGKHPRVSSKCVRCSKVVYAAEYCYSMSYPLHLSCLRCSACNRPLQPASYSIHNQLPYCTFPCYFRIFTINGYGRGVSECKP